MTDGSEQLRLATGPFQSRGLFSEHFLRDRLPEWPEFADRDDSALLAELRELWHRERDQLVDANEAQAEERFVQP